MRNRCFLALPGVIFVVSAGMAQVVPAGEAADSRPDRLFSADALRLLGDDARFVLTAPLRWDGGDWTWAGAAAAVVAGSSVFDSQIRNESQENRGAGLDRVTREFQKFGAEYSWLVLGGFAAWGTWGEDREARATALDGLAASVIAAGVVAPVLKVAVGRSRPSQSDKTWDLHPFGGRFSFPSGHTTQAFALATVIAEHYPRPWVWVLSYGSAGMVGYSRIQQNAHYASDVVAGAIIGSVVAHAVVKRNNQPGRKERKFALAPFSDGRDVGMTLSKSF